MAMKSSRNPLSKQPFAPRRKRSDKNASTSSDIRPPGENASTTATMAADEWSNSDDKSTISSPPGVCQSLDEVPVCVPQVSRKVVPPDSGSKVAASGFQSEFLKMLKQTKKHRRTEALLEHKHEPKHQNVTEAGTSQRKKSEGHRGTSIQAAASDKCCPSILHADISPPDLSAPDPLIEVDIGPPVLQPYDSDDRLLKMSRRGTTVQTASSCVAAVSSSSLVNMLDHRTGSQLQSNVTDGAGPGSADSSNDSVSGSIDSAPALSSTLSHDITSELSSNVQCVTDGAGPGAADTGSDSVSCSIDSAPASCPDDTPMVTQQRCQVDSSCSKPPVSSLRRCTALANYRPTIPVSTLLLARTTARHGHGHCKLPRYDTPRSHRPR